MILLCFSDNYARERDRSFIEEFFASAIVTMFWAASVMITWSLFPAHADAVESIEPVINTANNILFMIDSTRVASSIFIEAKFRYFVRSFYVG